MAFRIGQKVVCVDDVDTDREGNRELMRGQIYTIRWVGLSGFEGGGPRWAPRPCVRVTGIIRPESPEIMNELEQERSLFSDEEWSFVQDMPFRASRFRPVIERKTDTGMAILREILDRESHQDSAPAKPAKVG